MATKPNNHDYIFYKKNIEPSLNTTELLQHCLQDAFFAQDWCEMEALLKLGAFIDYRYDYDGTTLLFHCTTKESIIKLVEFGADINAKDQNGQSILGYAIRRNCSTDHIRLLLKLGAQVNVRGPFGYSPLSSAVGFSNKRLDLIKLLMEHKANVNGTDKYNPHKPISVSVDKNFTKLLIKYGFLHDAEKECEESLKKKRVDGLGQLETKDYLKACKKEIQLMKEETVNGKISFIEYLNKDFSNRLQIDGINTSKFPIYRDIIEETIQRVNIRVQLLGGLDEVINNVPSFQKHIKLDYDSTLYIIQYLENDDLENFTKAFETQTEV